jgi:hypothetical protein
MLGKDSGEGLSAKSPSPDPSPKTPNIWYTIAVTFRQSGAMLIGQEGDFA